MWRVCSGLLRALLCPREVCGPVLCGQSETSSCELFSFFCGAFFGFTLCQTWKSGAVSSSSAPTEPSGSLYQERFHDSLRLDMPSPVLQGHFCKDTYLPYERDMTKYYIQACTVTKSCPTLYDTMDCNLPDSSVHGISQAKILEWVSIPFSRGSSQPRDQTHVSWIGKWILYHCTTQEVWTLQTPEQN